MEDYGQDAERTGQAPNPDRLIADQPSSPDRRSAIATGAENLQMPVRHASEIYGQRERPYDMRWGTPEQVKRQFGINATVLKSAWASGWVRARQGNWENDDKRTQTIYCFEDIHGFIERVMHRVSEKYAEKWWTDDNVLVMAEKNPDGPYRRRVAQGGAKVRKDGFARLPKNPVD